MSYREYADKLDAVGGAVYTAVEHDAEADGIQAEYEQRGAAGLVSGIISGFAPSVVGTAIQIAAGDAYANGLRFSGGSAVEFVGLLADDYHVYVDPDTPLTPYKAKVAVPDDDEVLICCVTWNGVDTLSDMADARMWGIHYDRIETRDAGAVSTGVKLITALGRGFWIKEVLVVLGNTGSSSSTIVDVHAGPGGSVPDSIFTDQGNRPEVDNTDPDYTVAESSGCDDANRLLAARSVLFVEVDQAAAAAQDLGVVVVGRWLP